MFEGVPILALPPVSPPVTTGADQLKVVPAGTTPFVTSAGVTVNALPLQTLTAMFVIAGVGLILTVTINGLPVQVPVTGVTV